MVKVTPDRNQVYVRPHWTMGNTTVRNPLRLPPAVEALATARFAIGVGKESEEKFARWLDDKSIVSLKDSTEDVTSLGRKWRGALEKMGFIFPESHKDAFAISPMGHRLINARSDVEMQLVLRYAVASYRSGISYPLGVKYIHPLSWTIEVLRSVCDFEGRDYAEDTGISTEEFALFVQSPPESLSPQDAAQELLRFRNQRVTAKDGKRFVAEYIRRRQESVELYGSTYKGAVKSLVDYADANIRYLTMSGLVSLKGIASQRRAGIRLASSHLAASEAVLESFPAVSCSTGYFETHWSPKDIVIGQTESLLRQLDESRKRAVRLGVKLDDVQQFDRDSLQSYVLATESSIQDELEFLYARQQREMYPEILEGFNEIGYSSRGAYRIIDGDLKPSYLEWLLWRAFLALDGGVADSRSARGFRVDDELRPIGFAPPGRADLVFEFESFVLVVEATLMAGSRQEAAEGEPVRRHVADVVDVCNKPVYCLFVASKVDLNTVETFRVGHWYNSDESLLKLDIVPVTIGQFVRWFESAIEGNQGVEAVRKLVVDARDMPSCAEDAIAWRSDLVTLLA